MGRSRTTPRSRSRRRLRRCQFRSSTAATRSPATSSGTPIFRRWPAAAARARRQGRPDSAAAARRASYTYKADLIIGVCEGPIAGIGIVYKDQSIYFLFQLGLGSFNGTTPQDVWPYLAATYPANALAYQGTAYVWGAGYNLGDAAAIGNHNFEVIGILAGSGANGEDADPAQVIYDFLTNAQYGCGFNPASISSSALFGSNDASLQAYCKSIGLAFSPTLTSQEPASSILTRWLQLLNCAAVWSGGELKFIPYGDTAVASGASTTYQNQFSIPTPIPLSTGGVPAFVNLAHAGAIRQRRRRRLHRKRPRARSSSAPMFRASPGLTA